MSTHEHQRYRFGPLERRGLIGSLRPTQVIVIAASLTGGVVSMRVLTGGAGIFSALVLALVGTGSVSGQVIVSDWAGRRCRRPQAPLSSHAWPVA